MSENRPVDPSGNPLSFEEYGRQNETPPAELATGLIPRVGPPTDVIPPPWYANLPTDETNPYANRLREKPEFGIVNLRDRATLNAQSSFYRGTVTGSSELKLLNDIANGTPNPYKTADQARAELDQIHEAMARYESIPSYDGPIEAGAALAGQFGGAALSPESLITRVPGVGGIIGRVFGEAAETVAGRILSSAASQGIISGITDPLAQTGAIATGLQPQRDWTRTALAFPIGAVFGGGIQGAAELAHAFRAPVPTERPSPPTPAVTSGAEPVETAEVPPRPTAAAVVEPQVVGPEGISRVSLGEEQNVINALREVRRQAEVSGEPALPDLQRRVYAAVETATSDVGGPEIQRQLTELRRRLFETGETPETALQGVWGRDLVDAPPGLQQAIARDLAVQGVSPEIPAPGTPAIRPAAGDRAALAIEDPSTRIEPNSAAADVARPEPVALGGAGPAPARPDLAFAQAPAGQRPLPTPAVYPVEPSETLRSLHGQAFDLAEALNVPLRQGRIAAREAAGQYDITQDVIRSRVVADFDTVAHEAGHALEAHVGADLRNLTQRFAAELGPLDYQPQLARVSEGFAEWFSHYLTAPAAAQVEAPTFTAAFRDFMAREHPELAAKIDAAQAGYQRYLSAPSGARLDAIVRRTEPQTLMRRIREDGMAPTIKFMVGRAYETLLDQNAPVARAVRSMALEAYKASGKRLDLRGYNDPEKLVRLFTRAVQAAQENLKQGIRPYHQIVREGPSLSGAIETAHGAALTPMRRLAAQWNNSIVKDFSNYMIALRSDALWRKYDAGQLANRPLAMTKADVAQAIGELEGKHPTFRQAAEQVHGYTRQLLRKMYDGGLIERELYDKLAQEEFYVPMYRDLSEQPMAAGQPTAGAPRAAGPGQAELIRRQRGSDRDIIDPIQSLMTQTMLVERTLAHNDIIKSFVSLSRAAREAGATGVGRIVEEIPASEVIGKGFDLRDAVEAAGRQHGIDPTDMQVLQGALTDTFGEDPIMGTIFRRAPTRPRGEPIVFYKDGGQLKAVRLISDKEGLGLYEALAGLPTQMRDIALNWAGLASRALRIGVTTEPTYAISNFIRDQIAAAVLYPGYVPFNPMGIYRELRGDKWSHLYAYAGGMNPGAAATELTGWINRDIDELARKGWTTQKVGAVGDLLKMRKGSIIGLGRAVAETIGTAETGTRLNVFRSAFGWKKRQGLSDYDAMIEASAIASDLPDFSRHGSRTQTIRGLWVFLNAHMQSLDKARRAMFVPIYRYLTGTMATEQDLQALKTAIPSLGLFIGINGALGYAYGLWASKYEAYQDANHLTRSTNLIVPGEPFGYRALTMIIPKSFELAMGFNLGEAMALHHVTNDPRTAEQAMQGILDVLLPPNPLNPIPALSLAAELKLNRSFFTEREIVRPEYQGLVTAEQYTPTTSSLARWLGKQIGVSPIKIDYTIGTGFGLWGRDILAASTQADPNAPDVPPENSMFLRRFLKQADVASQTTETFWQLAAQQTGEYAQAKNTYDRFIQRLDDSGARDFLAHLPANKRTYVTLQSAADENGRPAFDPEEKKLQPLTRAAAAVTLINGYIRELTDNYQKQIDGGEHVDLNSKERREAIDGLREIQALEQRNALVILGESGYQGRKLLSVEDRFAVLRDQLPQVADELAARYATNRIYKTAEIAKAWPQAQKRLMAEGGSADLKDLAIEVMLEGPAFEGQRVFHPMRRRMTEIPALPAEMTAGMGR